MAGRQYIWRGVNIYGVIGGGGASIHRGLWGGVIGGSGTSIHMASSGVVGRQYIWRHSGWWGVNTYGVIGGGASIHMVS